VRWYRAPELLWGSTNYGPAVDVWAMGCVFAELLLRRPWFAADTDIKQLQAIFAVLGTPTPEQWARMVDLPSYLQFTASEGQPLHKLFPQVRQLRSCTMLLKVRQASVVLVLAGREALLECQRACAILLLLCIGHIALVAGWFAFDHLIVVWLSLVASAPGVCAIDKAM
jgi:serine/threonine protein kinase